MREYPPAKRHILYVNHDYPPVSGPGVWRALWFTSYLARSGYDTTVICADRSHWCDRRDTSLLEQVPATVRVKRIHAHTFTGDTRVPGAFQAVIRRYILSLDSVGWFVKGTFASLYAALSRRVDCVITSGPPHISHVMGWLIHTLTGRRWIMDYRDLWTDDPVHCPHTGFRRKLLEFVERRLIKGADVVMTVSPAWRDHLREKFKAQKPANRFVLIRNGFKVDDVPAGESPPPRADADRRLHIHSSGTPQPLSTSLTLFEAVGRLSATTPRERLPLMTFTGLPDQYKQEIAARNLGDCVVDVGAMSRQQSIAYSLTAEVLLVVVNNDNTSREGTIPAKTYEAMALGRHVLALVPPRSDVVGLLGEYGNATICNVDDADEIHQALRRLIDAHHAGTLTSSSRDGEVRESVLRKYSRASQARQLISLIEAISTDSPDRLHLSD